MAAADHSGQDQARSWTRYLPLAALGGAMVIVFATGAHRIFSLETIVAYRDKLQAFVDHYGPMAVIAYAAVYVVAVALSIPGAVFLTILGGFLFGWFFGGAVAAVSATLGAVLVFLDRPHLGRRYPRPQGRAEAAEVRRRIPRGRVLLPSLPPLPAHHAVLDDEPRGGAFRRPGRDLRLSRP